MTTVTKKQAQQVTEEMTDYLLVEPSSLDDLKTPLRGSARLKFTCFDVSSRYIAVGSNTGSVYIFDRISLRHLQVVFTEEEPSSVNNVKLCSTNKTVAFSMINGLVQVMELNIDRRQKPDRLRSVTNHLHQTVSCILWDPTGQRLYTADITGNVVVSNIPSSKMKNLVLVPVEVILTLSVPVVQLDIYQDKLLVSTRTECFLCNTAKHNYLQIGTKPRDGHYGACFLQTTNIAPIIYCARPGSRLWEVDIEGNVQHTHQFKQLLAIPPVQVLSLREAMWKTEEKEVPPLGINFPVLKSINHKFILTWNKTKLFILDPLQEQPKVILWVEFHAEISEAGVHGTEIYIFLTSGEMRKLILMSVSQTVSLLISRKLWHLAAQVCGTYSQSIIASHGLKHLSRTMLKDLIQNIQNGHQSEYEEKVLEVLEKINAEAASSSETEGSDFSRSRSSSGASIIRLDSGIYQIRPSKSSASLDSWNETGSQDQDELDCGLSSPTNIPASANEVIVTVLDENESEKDFNSNDTSKLCQMDSSLEKQSTEQSGETEVVSLVNGHQLKESGSFELEPHSSLIKDNLNRLINTDDIFAEEEVLKPRGSGKSLVRKLEHGGISKPESSEKLSSFDGMITNGEVMNGLIKEEIIEVVPVQDKDISPLIVTKPDDERHQRSSTRKKAVTVDIEGRKSKSGKQRQRNSRSKIKQTDRERKNEGLTSPSSEPISNSAPNEYSGNSSTSQPKSSNLHRTESCPAIAEKSDLTKSSPATELASPSESPLSQSWEEPNRMTLTSVKDSLQSKFANTKKKILDTIKEKKRMSSSPKEWPLQVENAHSITSSIPKEQEMKQEIPNLEPDQESSIVDLSEFIQKTVQTRSMLQDFSVLLNPDALWDTLSDWMLSFNGIMKKLNTQRYLKLLQSKHGEKCRRKVVTESSNNMDDGFDDNSQTNEEMMSQTSMDRESEQLKIPNVSETESEKTSSPLLEISEIEELSFQDFCNVDDPFPFPADLLGSVKDLTRQCFNSTCFRSIVCSVEPDLSAIAFCDICSDCYQNNETAISSVLNPTVNFNEDDGHDNPDDDELSFAVSLSDSIESAISHQGFSENSNSNFDFTKFIRCYFFLLDEKDFTGNVYSRESTLTQAKKYEVWKAWIQCLQDKNKEEPALNLLDQKSNEETLQMLDLTRHDRQRALLYVNKLFEKFPSETISFCIKCEHIQPMDIIFVCHHNDLKEADFLDQFMRGRYEDLQASNRLSLVNLISEDNVVYTWLWTLLKKTVTAQELRDEDGSPWLFSHSVTWVDGEMMDFILENVTPDQRTKCLKMCRESGYWRGCLTLLRKQKQWTDMTSIIFCLGDLQLFSDMDILPETVEQWESLISVFKSYYDNHKKLYHSGDEHNPNHTVDKSSVVQKEMTFNPVCSVKDIPGSVDDQKSNNDGDCTSFDHQIEKPNQFENLESISRSCPGNCVSWNEVASLMLQHMDESVCVDIWTKMDVPDGCIEQSLYQTSITMALKHRQQRNVMHNLLEKIDSYLWAKKPNTLMPQLQFALSAERKSRGAQKESTNDQLMVLLSEKPADGRRYMEDSECHWGVSTNILKCCRVCSVSLTESISHMEPGVLVFDCGHGFHKYCCQGRVCQLCS